MTITDDLARLRHPALGFAARLAFLVAAALVLGVAVFGPSGLPRVIYSSHMQHFAVWYLLTLVAAAAFPRSGELKLAASLVVFGAAAEALHSLNRAGAGAVAQNMVADAGGVAAALAPMVVQTWRRVVSAPQADPSADATI